MSTVDGAIFWLALVTYLLECDRIAAIRDMGLMCKSSCYEDARYRFDAARPSQWRPHLEAA